MIRESKIYQLRNLHLSGPIRKITWVLRDKELYGSHSAIGIWWKMEKGLKIANKNREIRYTIIGLYLGNYTTWVKLTYLKKCKSNKGLSVPEEHLDNYIKGE